MVPWYNNGDYETGKMIWRNFFYVDENPRVQFDPFYLYEYSEKEFYHLWYLSCAETSTDCAIKIHESLSGSEKTHARLNEC